jgi:hypothetical protein
MIMNVQSIYYHQVETNYPAQNVITKYKNRTFRTQADRLQHYFYQIKYECKYWRIESNMIANLYAIQYHRNNQKKRNNNSE